MTLIEPADRLIHRPQGLRDLADAYDAYVVDLWGVLHDGVTAFPEAVACLADLKALGKQVIILSNAPRRADSVARRNTELGIELALADLIMSSGEEAWHALKDRSDSWYAALGRRCYHLGPERDLGIREGLDLDFVAELTKADFILNTGALSSQDTADSYAPFLEQARQAGLPMVCANPDWVVIRGGREEICAGSIALAYEEMGGEVRYHGKPSPTIYHSCFKHLGIRDPSRVLVIGDSLRTDVAGGLGVGARALFIGAGIHAEELGLGTGTEMDWGRLRDLCDAKGVWPQEAMERLRW